MIDIIFKNAKLNKCNEIFIYNMNYNMVNNPYDIVWGIIPENEIEYVEIKNLSIKCKNDYFDIKEFIQEDDINGSKYYFFGFCKDDYCIRAYNLHGFIYSIYKKENIFKEYNLSSDYDNYFNQFKEDKKIILKGNELDIPCISWKSGREVFLTFNIYPLNKNIENEFELSII